MNNFNCIQIIGTQRSGSNLLRLMLNQMDEIVAPHPPHILVNFFPLLKKYGDLTVSNNFYNLLDDVCSYVELNPVPWGNVVFDRKELISSCQDFSLIEIFRVIYEAKANHENARYWCCKSMVNLKYHDFLESSGIKPFYIYLYRDGRDVALSFQKAIVGEKHIYNLANKWRSDQLSALKICESLPKNRQMSICYESLIHNPEKTIKTLCNKLEIPFQKDYLQFYTSSESKNTSDSGEMWKNVKKPVMKHNFNKYKTEMSREDLYIFESIAGDALVSLGYSLENNMAGLSKSFTGEDVEKFNLINNNLKADAQLMASKKDIEKRNGQVEFLNQRQKLHSF